MTWKHPCGPMIRPEQPALLFDNVVPWRVHRSLRQISFSGSVRLFLIYAKMSRVEHPYLNAVAPRGIHEILIGSSKYGALHPDYRAFAPQPGF